MCDRIAATYYQPVTAGQEADDPVGVCPRIPVKPYTRLEIVLVALGYREKSKALVAPRGCDDTFVYASQVSDGLTGALISEAQRKCEVWLDLPLVLPIEEEIVPIVVDDFLTTRQWLIDGRRIGDVIDVALQGAIGQPAADSRHKELFELVATNICSEFPGVISTRNGKVILELESVPRGELREIYRQTDGRAIRSRIKGC